MGHLVQYTNIVNRLLKKITRLYQWSQVYHIELTGIIHFNIADLLGLFPQISTLIHLDQRPDVATHLAQNTQGLFIYIYYL